MMRPPCSNLQLDWPAKLVAMFSGVAFAFKPGLLVHCCMDKPFALSRQGTLASTDWIDILNTQLLPPGLLGPVCTALSGANSDASQVESLWPAWHKTICKLGSRMQDCGSTHISSAGAGVQPGGLTCCMPLQGRGLLDRGKQASGQNTIPQSCFSCSRHQCLDGPGMQKCCACYPWAWLGPRARPHLRPTCSCLPASGAARAGVRSEGTPYCTGVLPAGVGGAPCFT